MTLDGTRRVVAAAILLVVEYLLVSLLFDARELVPASLKGIGDVAPMPVIAGVAVLILRASTPSSTTPQVSSTQALSHVSPRALIALLAAHIVTFAVFIAAGFVLRDAGELGQEPRLAPSLAWAACGALSASLLAAFALARAGVVDVARRAAAPLAVAVLVGAAAWAAGLGTGRLWHPLARLTLHPVHVLVDIFSNDVVVDVERFIVGLERFKIRIDPVCSGYEGMGLVAVLTAAYVWTFRSTLRFPHALALVVIAVAGAFVANVARITALIYVGALGSRDVAVSGFHSKAGWLLFCVVALAVTWLGRNGAFFQRQRNPAAPHGAPAAGNVTAGYLVPLLALVAGALTAGLAADGGLDHMESVALVAGSAALVWARATVRAALAVPAHARSRGLAVAVGTAVFGLWMGLDALSAMVTGADATGATDAAIAAQLAAWPSAAVMLWIGFRLVGSIVIAPLVEELAFRGFLLRRIVATDFAGVRYAEVTALAVVGSSLAFGALHDRWLAGALAGIAYALVVWRTGQLRDAVIAHAVTNALIAVVVLGFGRWALWT